jgi:hypothetical protein
MAAKQAAMTKGQKPLPHPRRYPARGATPNEISGRKL